MRFWKNFFVCIVCVAVVAAAILYSPRTRAEAHFSLSASQVSDGKFTVTVTFPAVNWKGFDLRLRFNSSDVQVKSTTKKDVFSSDADVSVTLNSVALANSGGEIRMAGTLSDPEEDTASSSTRFRFVFQTVSSAEQVTFSLVVNSCIDNNGHPVITYTSGAVNTTRTVTLQSPATDTNSETSSTVTHTDTNTHSTSSTDTNTHSSTNTSTNTSTNSSTNTSTNTSETDTSTDSSAQSETVSETDTETDVTSEISTGTLSDLPTLPTFLPAEFTVTDKDKETSASLSVGAITGISLGASALTCGVFILLGILRKK